LADVFVITVSIEPQAKSRVLVKNWRGTGLDLEEYSADHLDANTGDFNFVNRLGVHFVVSQLDGSYGRTLALGSPAGCTESGLPSIHIIIIISRLVMIMHGMLRVRAGAAQESA
jgi:hypothetical protein